MSKHINYGSFYKRDEKREEAPVVKEEQAPVEEKQEVEKVEEVQAAPKPKPVKIYSTVLGPKKVNMRFKADKKSQPINILAPGTKVEVLDQSNPEWTKIRYKDMTGYMMSQFLKKE